MGVCLGFIVSCLSIVSHSTEDQTQGHTALRNQDIILIIVLLARILWH